MLIKNCTIDDLKALRPDLYKEIEQEVILGKMKLTKSDIINLIQPLSDCIEDILRAHLPKLPDMTYNNIVDLENDIIDEVSEQLMNEFDDIERLVNKRLKSLTSISVASNSLYDKQEVEAKNVEEISIDNKENVEVGYVLRLFPSQDIGRVEQIKPLNNGLRKLVVKLNDGSAREFDDNDNQYEIIQRNKSHNEVNSKCDETYQEKKNLSESESIIADDLTVNHSNIECRIELSAGDEIVYNSTCCKVIAVKKMPSSTRLIIQYEDGSLDNVLCDYDRISLSASNKNADKRKKEVMPNIDKNIRVEETGAKDNSLLKNKINPEKDNFKLHSISIIEEDTSSQEYIIDNKLNRGHIIDNRGERVFSSEGQLIRLNKIFYRVNYLDSLVSMNIIQVDSKGMFSLGRRILSAKKHSPLFIELDEQNYLKQFNAVNYDSNCDEYYIQVGKRWYGSSGYYADLDGTKNIEALSEMMPDETPKQTDSQNIEVHESKGTPVSDNDYQYSDLEIEHVYLDSRGKVIEGKTSYEVVPGTNSTSESRKGKPWTQEEEELITSYFQQEKDIATIAENCGRTEVAIKSRLAKLGLIEYTYGQEEQEPVINEITKKADEGDFTIENSFTRCSIINKSGERVFSAEGKLKFINGRLYRLNQKNECFTLKSMHFNDEVWVRGDKKIVAYPKSELYRIMEFAIDNLDDIEEIVDSPVFEDCKLKVKGIWYKYNGELESDTKKEVRDPAKKDRDLLRVIKNPLYAVRRQAILRAMSFFRFPAKIKDIARTISRTAWGPTIKEEDVEDVISTMPEVDSIDGGYILKKKR